MKKRGQKVLLVTSVSANEGKSSTAANLALTLAEKGRKVLLVDLDLKKPSQYKAFKGSVEIKHFLEDYLEGRAEAEDILAYDSKDGLYLILQEKGIEQSTTWANSDRLRELLQKYRGEMDYIILDTSPMAVAADAEYCGQCAAEQDRSCRICPQCFCEARYGFRKIWEIWVLQIRKEEGVRCKITVWKKNRRSWI